MAPTGWVKASRRRLIAVAEDAPMAAAFGVMTRRVRELAGGRVVSLLEGGYDLEGLSTSVAAHVRELMKA